MSHLPSLHSALLFITRQKKEGGGVEAERRNAHVGSSRQNENDNSVYVNKRVSQQERVRKQRDEDKDIMGKKDRWKDRMFQPERD